MKKVIVVLHVLLLGVFFLGNGETHAFSVGGGIDIHGFVSQGYMHSDEYNYLAHDSEGGSFQFNEYALNFSKGFGDELRVGVQFLARDLGDIGNDKITIDWVSGDYRWQDWLGVRAGKLKMPFGLYGKTRDMDMLRAGVFLPSGVYHEAFRDMQTAVKGGSIYGTVPLKGFGSVNYETQYGTMDVDEDDSGIAKVIEGTSAPGSDIRDFDIEEVFAGSLQWDTPIQGLRLAYTTGMYDFSADMDIPTGGPAALQGEMEFEDLIHYTYGAEYRWRDLVLAAEYFNIEFDLTPIIAGIQQPKETTEMEGYYFSASYRLADWLQLGTSYSKFYPDADDHSGNNPDLSEKHQAWLEDIALSTRFDLNDYTIFKLEGHLMNGTANVLAVDNPQGFDERDWYMFAAKLTFSF